MIERRIIDQVIERAEIVDVVSDFVTLKRKGRDYIGLCPFHDDTRPSFSVSTSKNICKCFACGEGGNPLTFIMKHENLSFPEAIKYLARKYGIEVVEKQLSGEELEKRSEREQLLRANTVARDAYHEALLQGAEGRRIALSYFRERGLTDETIKEFELGYSPSDATFLLEKAKQEGIEVEALEKVGLALKTKSGNWIDRYRERIIFPIHSISGNVVGFGGRIMKQVENVGKYINSPASAIYDKSRELYGLYFAKRDIARQEECLVVEGYMDVLWMHQRGIKNVVASSGTALTTPQAQLIKRYAPNVTLIFDSDKAGIKGTLRGLDVCLERELSVNVVLLPDGEDPDSFARNNSLEDVTEYIQSHKVDGIQFKLQQLEKEYGTSAQGKTTTMDALAETLAYIKDAGSRELHTLEIANLIGVSGHILGQKVEQIRSERQRETQRTKEREIAKAQRREAEATPMENIATSTPLPSTAPTKSNLKSPRLKAPLMPSEVELLRYILFDGMKFLPSYQSATPGSPMGATVAEVIYQQTSDLRSANLLSSNFASLLDELIEQIETNPALNTQNFLTWHENDTIRYYASELLTKEEKLDSTLHAEFEKAEQEEPTFTKHLFKDILILKYTVVQNRIANLIDAIEKSESYEESTALLKELTEQNQMKAAMGKMLDERILSLMEK